MIDKATIFVIHRLQDEGLSHRQIAKRLKIARTTVKKYLENPEKVFESSKKKQTLKLEPYFDIIDGFLQVQEDGESTSRFAATSRQRI